LSDFLCPKFETCYKRCKTPFPSKKQLEPAQSQKEAKGPTIRLVTKRGDCDKLVLKNTLAKGCASMDREKIGCFISTLRKEKGMTQKELANQLHVSDRTISKWERGAGLPDASLMIRLSDLLGITVNELLTGERNPNKPYTEEVKEDIKEAVSILYQHVHTQEKKLRGRLLVALVLIAVMLLGVHFVLKKAGEKRILFPPGIECELLQRDADIEATLIVDRRNTGVYDYICAYDMDRYGNVTLAERHLWQSYTDAVAPEIYKELKRLCPAEITSVDAMETGYLVCSHKGPATLVLTETDRSLNTVFRYELDTSGYTAGLSTAFLSENVLYVLSYNSDEQRHYVTAVDKETGQETVDSFVYSDFVSDAGEDDRMGGFLFDSDRMWVRDDVLYFTETYHKGPTSVFGAYDLAGNKAVYFETIENSQIVMAHKEPEKGQTVVLINPMDYQPLELYTIDDTTMAVKAMVSLDLPNEYLTRQGSRYAAKTYYLFSGDMSGDMVAVLVGDAVSRGALEDDIGSCILVVYDRNSGKPVWRSRFMLDVEYEIDNVILHGGVR